MIEEITFYDSYITDKILEILRNVNIQSSPIEIGRLGSVIHSLQEPTYNLDPLIPA